VEAITPSLCWAAWRTLIVEAAGLALRLSAAAAVFSGFSPARTAVQL